MNQLKLCTLSLVLVCAALTLACEETCVGGCGKLQPGTIVEYVDAESNLHAFTADQNGCISFEAEDCGEYQPINIIAPEAPPQA
jgi:hypothetical protein